MDVEILHDIFAAVDEPPPPPAGHNTTPTPPRSTSSSVSSSFSLITLGSHVSEEDYVAVATNRSMPPTPVYTPPMEVDDYVGVSSSLPPEDQASDTHTPLPSPPRTYEPLLALLSDFISFVKIRIEMIYCFTYLKFTAWSNTCDHMAQRLEEIDLVEAMSTREEPRHVLEWAQGEARCVRAILQCRGFILRGNYVQAVLTCQQVGVLVTSRLREVEGFLLDIHSHAVSSYTEEYSASGSSFPPLMKWMWRCYARFLAVIPSIYSEKRKATLSAIVGPRTSTEENHQVVSPAASSTPSTHSHGFLPPARHATILSHDPDAAAAASNTTNHIQEKANIREAIDHFFRVSRGIYRQVSMVIVALTADPLRIKKQYVCPPRNAWAASCTPTIRRLSYRSTHSGHPQEEFTSPAGVASASADDSQHSDDDDSVRHNVISSTTAPNVELVIMSRLTATPVTPAPVPSASLERRQSSTYSYASTRRLMSLVNTSHIATSSASVPPVSVSTSPPRDILGPHPVAAAAAAAVGSLSQSLSMQSSASDVGALASVLPNRASHIIAPPVHHDGSTGTGTGTAEDNPPAAAHPGTPTMSPDIIPSPPDNGEWIDSHIGTIQAILEYNFHVNVASSRRDGESGGPAPGYESFDNILKPANKRKCLCVPMFHASNSTAAGQDPQKQRSQRSSPGIYVIAPLNDSTSNDTFSTKSLFRTAPDLLGVSTKASPLHKACAPPRLFLIGAAMDRVAPLQPHSSQYVDDGGRNMGASVRELCEMLAMDDIFSVIGEGDK